MPRAAAVSLTLDNSSFLSTIRQTDAEVDQLGRKGQRSMQLITNATDAAKRSITGMLSDGRRLGGMLATLGGAWSVGNAVRGAVKLQSSYRQIAFGVKDASGAMLTAAQVQQTVERSAAKTGQLNEEMAASYRELIDASGDLDFSRSVLEAVGHTSKATGDSLADTANLAEQLHTKFGVAADGMQDALAQVYGAAKQGGPKFSEFSDVIAGAGQELLAAGLEGKRGLDFMLGALVETDDRFKSLPKQVAGLKAVLRGLSDTAGLDKIANKLGLDPKGLKGQSDALARLRTILGKGTSGVDALLGSMGPGEEKETMEILFTDPFKKALAEAQNAGLKGKSAIDRALQMFDARIGDFGKATMTGAEMLEEAKRARETPEAQLTQAINRLNTAFAQPAIINGINDLAKHLPKLADIVGKIVSFAAEHPIVAGAAGIGGKVAADAMGSFASDAIGGWLAGKLGGKGKGKGGAGGGIAGAALGAVSGILRHQQFSGLSPDQLGDDAWDDSFLPHELKRAGIGKKLGKGFMGGGAMASAGRALPIVGAIATAGLMVGEQIGNAYDSEASIMRELQDATAAGMGANNVEQKRAALDRLKSARGAAKGADIGGGAMDWFARTVTGVDTRQQAAQQMQLAAEAMARLVADINGKTGDNAPGHTVTVPETTIMGRVKIDDATARMMANATATALGGKVLSFRLANPRDITIGPVTVTGPGGSRGPMKPDPLRPGGAV